VGGYYVLGQEGGRPRRPGARSGAGLLVGGAAHRGKVSEEAYWVLIRAMVPYNILS
jgi:hypothetical protein